MSAIGNAIASPTTWVDRSTHSSGTRLLVKPPRKSPTPQDMADASASAIDSGTVELYAPHARQDHPYLDHDAHEAAMTVISGWRLAVVVVIALVVLALLLTAIFWLAIALAALAAVAWFNWLLLPRLAVRLHAPLLLLALALL